MRTTSKAAASRLPSSNPRRRSPVLLLICIVVAIGGLLLLLTSILGHSGRCDHSKPRSVYVNCDNSDNLNTWISDGVDNGERRIQKFKGFVGIQTGFGSAGRRQSIRKTWLSLDRWGLQRLEESTGLVFRFVIGRSKDNWKMEELKKEVENYDDFMLLDIDDTYSKLPYKTLAFFKSAYALFECDFYVKIDDDVYLRPDRLSLLLAKERSHSQTYMGCMKKGPVFTDPKLKWYEPLSSLLGSEYFLHAYGPIYCLSNDVVASLVALRNNSFRMFSNEDVTIGVWMLAMNVNHENNFNLCSRHCTSSSIAVWDIPKCSGLCHPERRMLELHQNMTCRSNALTPPSPR